MSPVHMEKFESAIRLAAEYNNAFNRMDLNLISSLLDEDCIFEEPGNAPDGIVYKGRDSIMEFLKNYFSRSGSIKREAEEVTGAGKKCIFCWKCSRKDNSGLLETTRGVDIFTVKNDLVTGKSTYIKG